MHKLCNYWYFEGFNRLFNIIRENKLIEIKFSIYNICVAPSLRDIFPNISSVIKLFIEAYVSVDLENNIIPRLRRYSTVS